LLPVLALLINWSRASLTLRAPDAFAFPRNQSRFSDDKVIEIDCLLIERLYDTHAR
jgi:hypothetical protein